MTQPEQPRPDPGNSPPEDWTAPLPDDERERLERLIRGDDG